MNQLLQPHGEIDPFTDEDRSEADAISKDMEHTIDSIRSGELRLATSYARLGSLLLKVKQKQHWIYYGYQSFGKYIDDLRGKIGRQRSQLYNVVSVAERLLPSMTEADLEQIGVTRANELAKFVKQSGRNVTPELLEIALDPKQSVDKLHVAVMEALHQKADPKGTWWDASGCYLLPDERKEVNQAIGLAMITDPPISRDLPDHEIWKHVILKFAREFYGTYVHLLDGASK
jgi:UDP-N-acetylglucosamine transferase subunit ALG13